MFLLKFAIFFDQRVDTINHLLHQLDFAVSQAMLVGDVEGASGLSSGFSSGASGLNVELLTAGFQYLQSLLGVSGEVHVNTGPHASSQVGRAGVNITILGVKHEVFSGLGLDAVTDSLDAPGKPVEDSTDITASLHRDDPQLILLIDPGQECLILVVEDSATFGPVPLHSSNNQVSVPRHEKEMIIHKLLPDFLAHASQGIVGSGQITGKVGKCLLHQVLHALSLLPGDSGGESKSVNASADPDPGGVDGGGGVDVAVDLGDIHVTGMDSVGGNAMVILDDGIENIGEHLVGVPISSINSTVLVIELNCASNGLSEGEARSRGLCSAQLVPDWLCDILRHKTFGGLNFWEWFGHFA